MGSLDTGNRWSDTLGGQCFKGILNLHCQHPWIIFHDLINYMVTKRVQNLVSSTCTGSSQNL